MSHDSPSMICPQCQSPLAADAPGGLCPACLMSMAALPTDQDTLPIIHADFPGLGEIAAAFPELEILEKIGQGGMGVVFKARQPRLGRLVALKILPKALASTPGFPQRFTREGQVLARLSHPNIVAIHDFGEKEGFCYLLMEYVEGVNLRQALRAGRFTPEQALKVIPEICIALQYAHDQGVLHRDIKPENLLLDRQGRVKIADFGIAKLIDDPANDALLTQSGAKLGTAPYMAPEQIEKPALVDHRADIYSLGVVLYEMLTGELPLGRFAPPSEKAAVGGHVDTVVFRALENDRERRQQSVGEFKTQVEGLGDGRLETPQPPAQPPHLDSFEYKSLRSLFGMPLLHVTAGTDPATGRRRVARGIIACGDVAVGVVAFGGYARGFFACGGCAVGAITIGGVGIGLISWSGLALALFFAMGGMAVAPIATGGATLGWKALGAIAVGWEALGGHVFAHHGMGQEVHATVIHHKITEMSPVLQWIASKSSWIGLGAFLWMPLILPMMLLPWWARARVEQLAQVPTPGAAAARPRRWILPAATMASAIWILLPKAWNNATPDPMSLLLPTLIILAGLAAFTLSLPLLYRSLPPDIHYGISWPAAWRSPGPWYDIHHYAGKQLCGWSVIAIAAGFTGFFQLPMHQHAYPWAAVSLVLVAFVGLAASVLARMKTHPADGRPPVKYSLPLRWVGHCTVAFLLAMFVRTFMIMTVRIPEGNEPGVAKKSAWIVSRLDSGFTPGNLIVFEHESGQHWIARVVSSEAKGLQLKRGGKPDEFFIPRDKIVGKMLFSYLSPWSPPPEPNQKPASKSAAGVQAPLHQGTSRALDQPPVLRFTRLKKNGQPWKPHLYDLQGRPVTNTESLRLVERSADANVESENADDCWLQLWFEHPDFDRQSRIEVSLSDENGQPIADRNTSFAGPAWSSDRPFPPLLSCAISPGKTGHLPPRVTVALRYSIGPWSEAASKVHPDFRGSMALPQGAMLAGLGSNSSHEAFVSWNNSNPLSVQYECLATLRNGHRTPHVSHLRSGNVGGSLVESMTFEIPLEEVRSFEFRFRPVKDITFPAFSLPLDEELTTKLK